MLIIALFTHRALLRLQINRWEWKTFGRIRDFVDSKQHRLHRSAADPCFIRHNFSFATKDNPNWTRSQYNNFKCDYNDFYLRKWEKLATIDVYNPFGWLFFSIFVGLSATRIIVICTGGNVLLFPLLHGLCKPVYNFSVNHSNKFTRRICRS